MPSDALRRPEPSNPGSFLAWSRWHLMTRSAETSGARAGPMRLKRLEGCHRKRRNRSPEYGSLRTLTVDASLLKMGGSHPRMALRKMFLENMILLKPNKGKNYKMSQNPHPASLSSVDTVIMETFPSSFGKVLSKPSASSLLSCSCQQSKANVLP